MDKYTLLLILNLPFVFFGYIKATELYQKGSLSRGGLGLRLLFWTLILLVLAFIKPIYNFLFSHNLTNSTPLSIADVVLVTGLNFCLFLCLRLYSKIDILEKQLTDVHEKLSIWTSPKQRR